MKMRQEKGIRGRGSTDNPTGRFERLHYDGDESFVQCEDGDDDDPRRPRTEFFRDHTRGIIARVRAARAQPDKNGSLDGRVSPPAPRG